MRSITRSGMKSGQMRVELEAFIRHLRAIGARSYLEVGARYGDTFWDVMKSLPKGSKGACVDMPGHYWGTPGSDQHLRAVCHDLENMGYDITLIMGDSQVAETQQKVSEAGPFDAALLDGDHRYEGIKADFEAYSPMASHVALHDIVGHGQRHGPGVCVEVPRLWAEIRHDGCEEFIAPGSKMGIGVWTT